MTDNLKTLSPASLFGVKPDEIIARSDEESFGIILAALESLLRFESRRSGIDKTLWQWRFLDQNVKLRIQAGPSCGLVALQMAAEHLRNESLPKSLDLLSLAKQRQYTLQGEMFSAFELMNLANESLLASELQIATKLVDLADASEFAGSDENRIAYIHRRLCENELLLLAYDADKDNTPCCLGGKRAHWTIIKGIVFGCASRSATASTCSTTPKNGSAADGNNDAATTTPIESQDSLKLIPLSKDAKVNVQSTKPTVASEADAINVDASDVWFICQHAKSKRPALFNALALLKSTAQLSVPDTSRNTNGEYRMPASLIDCLANKLLVVSRK